MVINVPGVWSHPGEPVEQRRAAAGSHPVACEALTRQLLTVGLAKHLQLTGQLGEISKKTVHRVRREARHV